MAWPPSRASVLMDPTWKGDQSLASQGRVSLVCDWDVLLGGAGGSDSTSCAAGAAHGPHTQLGGLNQQRLMGVACMA